MTIEKDDLKFFILALAPVILVSGFVFYLYYGFVTTIIIVSSYCAGIAFLYVWANFVFNWMDKH